MRDIKPQINMQVIVVINNVSELGKIIDIYNNDIVNIEIISNKLQGTFKYYSDIHHEGAFCYPQLLLGKPIIIEDIIEIELIGGPLDGSIYNIRGGCRSLKIPCERLNKSVFYFEYVPGPNVNKWIFLPTKSI